MPSFYIYARVSHRDQEKGESIDGQITRGKRKYEEEFQEQGYAFGGTFVEPGHVSGRIVPFMKRKAGQEACATLKPDDVLYVDKVDRLWRDIHDFSDLLRWFKSHKIVLLFGNLMGATLKTETPLGDFMLGLMVLIAQLESDQLSDRVKIAFRHEVQNGYWVHSRRLAPIGTKVVDAKPRRISKRGKVKKMLVWDWDMRVRMAEIVRMHDVDKLDFYAISDEMAVKYEPEVKAQGWRQWNWQRCQQAYCYEKFYAHVQDPRYMDLKELEKSVPIELQKARARRPAQERARHNRALAERQRNLRRALAQAQAETQLATTEAVSESCAAF